MPPIYGMLNPRLSQLYFLSNKFNDLLYILIGKVLLCDVDMR